MIKEPPDTNIGPLSCLNLATTQPMKPVESTVTKFLVLCSFISTITIGIVDWKQNHHKADQLHQAALLLMDLKNVPITLAVDTR